MTILKWTALTSFVLSLILLTLEVWRTRSFGRHRLYSHPAGNAWRGILYALGQGMLPWEKESAAKHLPTYIAGIFYHGGIFAAIFFALTQAVLARLPRFAVPLLQILMVAGLLAGAGLLIKRVASAPLRAISCLDDFVANLLVDLFLLGGLLASWRKAILPAFLIIAALTFIYMPVGKIRHCFFFFYSRILFGSYFGRRGVLPRPTPSQFEVRS